MQPGEFIAFQSGTVEGTGSEPPQPPPTRLKRYASRSRKGCITCRRRRVRCDEAKPECQRCVKAQVSCIYDSTLSGAATNSSGDLVRTTTSFRVPHAPSSLFGSPDELMDFQFWTEVGASNIGRWHCPSFYEELLPQFSSRYESTRFTLLAVSVCIRQWHVSTDDERQLLMQRGIHYYGEACRALVQPSDNSRAAIEAAVVSSLALFCFDSFTDHMARRYIHSNATLSMLRLLKQGLTYNSVSGWRSQTGKVGAQTVIETAESYLNDVSYPLSESTPARSLAAAGAVRPDRARVYSPMWLRLDPRGAMSLVDSSTSIAALSIEPPSTTWTLVEVVATDIQECHTYLALWHCWLFTWLITNAESAVEVSQHQQLSRQWHSWLFAGIRPNTPEVQAMQNRALVLDRLFTVRLRDRSGTTNGSTEQDLVEILQSISNNIELSTTGEDAPREVGIADRSVSRYLRGLAKVPDFVQRRSGNPTTRQRAYDLLSLRLPRTTSLRSISDVSQISDAV